MAGVELKKLRWAAMSLPHAQAQARIIAHGFQIPWHRVTELSDTLSVASESATNLLHSSFPEAFDRRAMDETVDRIFGLCGSPIEELFLAHLSETGMMSWYSGFDQEDTSRCGTCELGDVFIQHRVLSFRLDLAISKDDGKSGVAIELDGHDFHERTKEQAQRDKSRDRKIQAAGWSILRFTGSEIWRNPDGCVDEALSNARKILGGQK